MSRDIAPFGVRMPAELKEYLTNQAKENKRSLNAEIVARLEITMQQDELHTGGFVHFIDEYLDLMADKESLKRENETLKAGLPPQSPSQRHISKEDMQWLIDKLTQVVKQK